MRQKTFTKQLIVRVDQELLDALERDAAANERTVAQSVRFHLRSLRPTQDAGGDREPAR